MADSSIRHWYLTLVFGLFLGINASHGVESFTPVEADPMGERLRWRSYPELSGLSTQCLGEARDGTVWFGMVDALWRYDGFQWENEPFVPTNNPGGEVVSIVNRPNGNLVVGMRWGILELINGAWVRLTPFQMRLGAIRKVIAARDGSIWAASASGALRFFESKWTLHTDAKTASRFREEAEKLSIAIHLIPEAIINEKAATRSERSNLSAVVEDAKGIIWFGTVNGEVIRFDPAAPTGLWEAHNESDGMIGGTWPSILPHKDGSIWVISGSKPGVVNKFNGDRWRTEAVREGVIQETIGSFIQTHDGVVWISSRYVVSAFRDGKWTIYKQPEFPIPTAANFLLEASDGALWMAGPGTEVFRLDYATTRWKTYIDLNFYWESPSGKRWYLHRDGRVVMQDGDQWQSFSVDDGIIDTPVALSGTKNGSVWIAGSHRQLAATATFDGQAWRRTIHSQFSWGIDWRAVFESSDGSIWFGAAVDSSGPHHHRCGILQYKEGVWTHHHQSSHESGPDEGQDVRTMLPFTRRPEPIGKFICIGESRDGRVWAGRNLLAYHDASGWRRFTNAPRWAVETMLSTREGELWIGTRQFGARRYNGVSWEHIHGKDGLVANSVRSLAQTADGSIWAATDRNISRFDGQSWAAAVLPAELTVPHDGGGLKADPASGIWVNRFPPEWMHRGAPNSPHIASQNGAFWTTRYEYRRPPPETTIRSELREVSQPGNISIAWNAAIRWQDTKAPPIQFSYRLDGGAWSAYSAERGQAFFTLRSGPHRLEVRARDVDFNVDSTPAALEFAVLPPIWKQPWFNTLIFLLVLLIAAQSMRVISERTRLSRANKALAEEAAERLRVEGSLRELNLTLDRRVNERTAELEAINRELESFSYSVSHDLRAPLRSIDGFSRALLEDYAEKLDDEGKENLQTVRAASQRMGLLIDDMLRLSQLNRREMHWFEVDLSELAEQVARELKKTQPAREVEFVIAPGCVVCGDASLLRIALENILDNAWKYTSKEPAAKIEFGAVETSEGTAYFVRDNGCGFDSNYVHKLFRAFQRLHSMNQYPGTGIGLASVQRVIQRHSGRVWIEGKVGQGVTLYFTVPKHKLTL